MYTHSKYIFVKEESFDFMDFHNNLVFFYQAMLISFPWFYWVPPYQNLSKSMKSFMLWKTSRQMNRDYYFNRVFTKNERLIPNWIWVWSPSNLLYLFRVYIRRKCLLTPHEFYAESLLTILSLYIDAKLQADVQLY